MKIQCACGMKYSFEVTPEMVRSPVRFVCQSCGADNSAAINHIIRQQFATGAAAPAPVAIAPPPVAIAPPPSQARSNAVPVPAPAAVPGPLPAPSITAAQPGGSASAPVVPRPVPSPGPLRVAAPAPVSVPGAPAASAPVEARRAAAALRLSGEASAVSAGGSAAAAAPPVAAPQVCTKHPPQLTTHRCLVCQKPICPKCMEIFGFVCSAFCKGKAESQGIELPVYAGQRDVAQSRAWRKIALISGSAFAVAILFIGAWGWYAWVGSVPKVAFAVRLADKGTSGQLGLLPPEENQVVFLHAGTLFRHDTKARKEVWSNLLIDKKRLAEEAKATWEKMKADFEATWKAGGDTSGMRVPELAEVVASYESSAAAELHLYQRGQQLWVLSPDKATRFDWQTGQSAQQIPLVERPSRVEMNGDELLLLTGWDGARQTVTTLNLVSGETKTEEVGEASSAKGKVVAANTGLISGGRLASARATGTNQPALRTPAGGSGDKPLDPKALAKSYQNLSLPSKLAAPAVVAANANQQRTLAEMREPAEGAPGAVRGGTSARSDFGATRLHLTKAGYVQIGFRLLEQKTIQRVAMKEPPKKSALEGDVNASATAAVANELLNEMQRNRGGGVVMEDVSRYEVRLKRPGVKDWVGEVNGSGDVFPLDTVDVVAGGKQIVVVDHNNQKRWESQLNYTIRRPSTDRFGFSSTAMPYGQGPCVERGDTLFVFDDGVLTSFDLASGNVRWRLPSVGTTGLFFDDKGFIYVNTTTATPDNIKYSRQIDVSDKVRVLVLKVDPKTGTTLWRAVDEGEVSYVSGKFVYTTEAHIGENNDEDDPLRALKIGLEIPPHIRVCRLDAGNGRVLWKHYQKRAPLDVRFDANSFQILFKHEMQVLRFLTL